MGIIYNPGGDGGGGGGGASILAQSVKFTTSALVSGSAAIPPDNTKPQISEGTEFLACAITPKHADSTLRITVCINLGIANPTTCAFALFKDSEEDAVAVTLLTTPGSTIHTHTVVFNVPAADTVEAEFLLRIGSFSTNDVYMNSYDGNPVFDGLLSSTMIIDEIRA